MSREKTKVRRERAHAAAERAVSDEYAVTPEGTVAALAILIAADAPDVPSSNAYTIRVSVRREYVEALRRCLDEVGFDWRAARPTMPLSKYGRIEAADAGRTKR